MTKLSEKDLRLLDSEIDESIGSETVLTLPRDIGLINLLRVFEDYCRLFAISRANFLEAAPLLKRGQDGMQFALIWIYRYSPLPTAKNTFDLATDTYLAAGSLHEAAMRYSNVWDLMAQLQRGVVTGRRRNGVIQLEYVDPNAEVFDTCSHFLASPDAPSFAEGLTEIVERFEPAKLLQAIEIRVHQTGRIKYFVPDNLFQEIATGMQEALAPRWELGNDWDLGGYTVLQFRQFWIALLTFCWIHHLTCYFSGGKGGHWQAS